MPTDEDESVIDNGEGHAESFLCAPVEVLMPRKTRAVIPHVLPPLPAQAGKLRTALQADYAATFLEGTMQRFLEVLDPLNCLSELALARALLQDFLEQYAKQQTWFQTWGDSFADPTSGAPPKPVKLLTPDQSLRYIEVILRTVEQVQRIRESDLLSRAEMRWTIVQFGQVVEEEVAQTEGSAGWKDDVLMRIQKRWMKIWV